MLPSLSNAGVKQKIILSTVKKGKQNQTHNKKLNPNIDWSKSKFIDIQKGYHSKKCSKQQTLMDEDIFATTFRFERLGQVSEDNKHQFSQSLIQKWSIGDFEILQQLGHGKFGQVYAARELQTDFVVALKKMSRIELTENNFQKQLRRQVIIQSSLKHDNILKLFGYFWDEQAIYLILEYAPGGQLYGYLKKYKKFCEKNVSIIIRQVLQALKYLHQKSIIHRDIKPENLLISLGSVKMADFGWSIHSDKRRDTLCGTLDYLAPEVVKGSSHDSSIDIWEVGVLTYELAVGHPPFQTNSYDETYDKIVNSDVIFPEYVSFELRKFVRKCLQKRPEKRLRVEQCLSEDFIQAYLNEELDFQN